MNLLNLKSGNKQRVHYKSIHDLPMYNWISMRRDEDFSYLLIDEHLHGKNLIAYKKIDLQDVYLEMITEFFKEFGQPKKYINELNLKAEIIDLNTKFIETGENFLLNSIEMLNQQLKEMRVENIDEHVNLDINKEIGIVGKHNGVIIDTKRVTVVQYYRMFMLVNNEN